LKKSSHSCGPVLESMPAHPIAMYGHEAKAGQLPSGVTDVLTIGEEATVFRPVQRALRATGWAVAGASSLEAANAWLRSNVAAVAVADAELVRNDLSKLVSSLRSSADAPEVVVLTWNELALQDALEAGAFDVVERPLDQYSLVWAVATAWHNWITRRERATGGGRCSDA
jgi:DNA-binding NtrC family response regulator